MFPIETKKLKMTLEIVPVSSLFSHEAILEPSASKLVLEFKNLASLQNPIIVDENHVVLDGNHRAYAFKVLRFKYIPVCKIDYFNRRTKLRYWFRLLGNLPQKELVESIITSLGGTLEAQPNRSALERALDISGPVVIDCHVEPEENVFPMIPAGGSVKDIIVSW